MGLIKKQKTQQKKEKENTVHVKQTFIVKSLKAMWKAEGSSGTGFEIIQKRGPGLNQISTDGFWQGLGSTQLSHVIRGTDEMVLLQDGWCMRADLYSEQASEDTGITGSIQQKVRK